MEQRGNASDHFEADECREHENEQRVDQMGTHLFSSRVCLMVKQPSPSIILAAFDAPACCYSGQRPSRGARIAHRETRGTTASGRLNDLNILRSARPSF